MHRGEPRQQDAAPGERLRTECGRQRERRGESRRDRGEERSQGKRDEIAPRQCRGIGVNDDANRDGGIHEDEIARRREDGGLLGAGGTGRAHELGGAPEIGSGSCCRNFGNCLAAAHQGA